MAKYTVLTGTGVRKLVKQNGKRCGNDFISTLDKFVHEKIIRCCQVANGRKKTLDATLLNLVK